MLQILKRVMPPSVTKVVYAIITAVAGSAAWESMREGVSLFKHPGTLAFTVGVLILLLALVCMAAYADTNDPPSPSGPSLRQRRRDLWMFLLGLFLLLACIVYYRSDSTQPPQATTPAPVAAPLSGPSQPSQRQETLPSTTLRAPKTPALAAPAPLFDTSHLNGRRDVIALASRGDAGAVQHVLDALDAPFERGALTAAFHQKYFERALSGEHRLFADRPAPAQLGRIVVLKAQRAPARKVNFPADAIRITETVSIAVIDARTGSPIWRKTITVDGDGYTEQFAEASLRENLEASLAGARLALEMK